MYHVLAAHDLTARSDVALVRAARLAFDRKGHLTILHVVDSDLPAPVVDAQRMRTENYLEIVGRRWLGNDTPSYRVEIASGDPAATISAEADARTVDLVVTGRHRRRPVADMFVGTTVERLLRLTRRPILVVNNPNQAPYQSVLIPVDFSDASTAAIRLAATFLPKANLHLLHAYKGAFQDYVAALSLTFSREERAKFAGPIGEQAADRHSGVGCTRALHNDQKRGCLGADRGRAGFAEDRSCGDGNSCAVGHCPRSDRQRGGHGSRIDDMRHVGGSSSRA